MLRCTAAHLQWCFRSFSIVHPQSGDPARIDQTCVPAGLAHGSLLLSHSHLETLFAASVLDLQQLMSAPHLASRNFFVTWSGSLSCLPRSTQSFQSDAKVNTSPAGGVAPPLPTPHPTPPPPATFLTEASASAGTHTSPDLPGHSTSCPSMISKMCLYLT